MSWKNEAHMTEKAEASCRYPDAQIFLTLFNQHYLVRCESLSDE